MRRIKDIISIGSADIVGSGIAAVFWFYLATLILPSEYGQIHYFISIAAIASTFSLIGQQQTIIVYISKNKAVFSTLFFASLLCSIVSFIALFLFFNKFDIGLLVIGFVLFSHGAASNLGYQNFKKYTIYSVLQKSLMVIFALGAYYFFGIEWILLGIALSYFVYSKVFFDGLSKFKIDFSQLKNHKKFISSNYFLMLTNLVTTQVDKLLIVPILGFAVLGNYSLALQVIAIMTVLPSVVFKYILPRSSRGFEDKALQRNTILVSFLLTGVGVFVLPTILPIFFEKFTEVAGIVQIMSLAVIPITINTFYFAKFLALENAKIPLLVGIIASIVLVIGMIILGSVYGTTGVAIAYVLTYSSACLVSYVMNRRLKTTKSTYLKDPSEPKVSVKTSIRIYRNILKNISGKGLHRHKIFRRFNQFVISVIQSDFTEFRGFRMYLGNKQARQYSVVNVEEEYNPLEMEIIKENVKPGDNVIDVGANLGFFTLPLSRFVGDKGRVFSFEPEPENFRALEKNILINKLQNVTLENLAISNENGTTKLFISEDHGAHTIFEQTSHKVTGKSIDTHTMRLDDYFLEKSIDEISFIKIDVEGVEFEVLKGMKNLLEKNTHINLLIEFIPKQLLDFGTDPNELLDFLIERKFSVYLFDYNEKRIRKLNSVKDMKREENISVNIFCKRDVS